MKKEKLILIIVILLIITTIFFIQKNKTIPSYNSKDSTIIFEGKKIDPKILMEKEKLYKRAIEIVNPDGYINIDNINIAEHLGKKVILVDFWTYSCINCQRTIPYLNEWYEKYKDQGLLIIGVHTPEFEFEKNTSNVKRAVEKFGIKYPVVQDNNYETFRAYGNRYWPRKYLIDIDGFIVYDHVGEGGYEETEKKIQELLIEREKRLKIDEEINKNISKPNITDTEFDKIKTPEIYFGYGYSRGQLGNKEGFDSDKNVSYNSPKNIEENKYYLEGEWENNKDYMLINSQEGRIILNYTAKSVNLVAGSNNPVEIETYIDGKLKNNIKIYEHDLYPVFIGEDYNNHVLDIRAKKGLKAYTFTFG